MTNYVELLLLLHSLSNCKLVFFAADAVKLFITSCRFEGELGEGLFSGFFFFFLVCFSLSVFFFKCFFPQSLGGGEKQGV